MRSSTLVSLRANTVLIALCIAASDAAWLTVCGCTGHVHALENTAVRLATLASAVNACSFVVTAQPGLICRLATPIAL